MNRGNGHKLAHHFHHPPHRIVSLVPSLTESLFDLGFGAAVVGITDYCVHPARALSGLPRLGGPKNPRVDEIIALKPDLVIANQEENTPQVVEALEKAGIFVWVTFPRTVAQALDVLWTLVGLFQSKSAATQLQGLEMALDWVKNAVRERPPVRYFCPIWFEKRSNGQPWWMTFNRHTYAHDLLQILGGENVFAERQRRYPLEADLGLAQAQEPGGRDTRYPRLGLDEICAADPEMILLPDEPFAFDETHRQEMLTLFKSTRAVQQGRVHLIDGSLITWHGTRLGRALQILPSLFD